MAKTDVVTAIKAELRNVERRAEALRQALAVLGGKAVRAVPGRTRSSASGAAGGRKRARRGWTAKQRVAAAKAARKRWAAAKRAGKKTLKG